VLVPILLHKHAWMNAQDECTIFLIGHCRLPEVYRISYILLMFTFHTIKSHYFVISLHIIAPFHNSRHSFKPTKNRIKTSPNF
jgi:hypothetical protein